jgi:hypothetical protein
MITIKHNLSGKKFKWLWAKYVQGVNLSHHCTNSLKGPYSKKFSKLNPNFDNDKTIQFDESDNFKAIYICGVSTYRYKEKENYPYNLHLVLTPHAGNFETWNFLNWELKISNAKISKIIDESQLSSEFQVLPREYTTCRIFRWAASEGLMLENSEKTNN